MRAPTCSFLMDLDAELTTHASLVDREIILQGLLSRQVALVEANLFDSPAIRLFFANHWRTLSAMAKAPGEYETPLLASASRTGRDVYAGLDQLLARGDPPRPAWFSSLSREQNEALRADYEALKDADQRRARFVEVVRQDIGTYLRHLTEYVGGSEARTVVDSANTQTRSLYERVSSSAHTVLGEMTSPKHAPHREAAQALLAAIQKLPPGEPQTREYLHRALYDWQVFYANNGVVRRDKRPTPHDAARDEWRFVVNTHWGQHIADRIGLADTHHADWFDLGTLGEALRALHLSGEKPRCVRSVRLPTALDAADFDFVAVMRREEKFWQSLQTVERSRDGGDAQVRLEAWLAHFQFVSDRLASWLSAKGEPVQPSLHELWELPLAGLSIAIGVAAGGIVLYHTLNWGAALATAYGTATSTRGGFYYLDLVFGGRKISRGRLRAFRNEFRALGP